MKRTGSHQGRSESASRPGPRQARSEAAPKSSSRMQKDIAPPPPEQSGEQALNHEQQRIRDFLEQVRFKKAVFGGVDEADMWKKIGELNSLYEAAISAERARYDALMQEHVQAEALRMARQLYAQAMNGMGKERAGGDTNS